MGVFDNSYQLLFSHPRMVRDLLEGFVHQDWVARLDFDSLERQSGKYVSTQLHGREQDVVWKARLGDDDVYLYFFIELQSRPDRLMAMRMMGYLAGFYENLARQEWRGRRLLPPVLPLVLYRGDEPWRAARSTAELVTPITGDLARYVPRLEYLLLDERALAASGPHGRNLAEALFSLEHNTGPEVIAKVLRDLATWLAAPDQQDLRQGFTILARHLIRAHAPSVDVAMDVDLVEVAKMLETSVKKWKQRFREEVRAEARAEARVEAEAEVEARGEARGKTALLLRLLEKRFGPLSPAQRHVVQDASSDQLEAWTERLLDAPSLENLIEGDLSH